jgi:phosphoglycerol transferase MdoB-like AlkP superfamily enzyme
VANVVPALEPNPYLLRRGRSRLGQFLTALGRRLWQPLALADRRPGDYADLVSLVFAVCAALVATKAVLAYLDLTDPNKTPFIYDGNWLTTLGRLVACCAADLAVGLGCLFLAGVALRLAPIQFGCRRVVRASIYLLALAALFLTVVDAHLFHQMRRFLTLDLFEAGGGFQPETSIWEYAALAKFKVTVVLLPLLTLVFHLGIRQARRLWQVAAATLCRPAVLLLLIAGLLLGSDAAQNTLCANGRSDFAQNPHLLLVGSFFKNSAVEDFAGPGPGADEPDPWPPELVADFLPGRPRPSGLVKDHPHNIILICVESFAVPYLQLYGAPYPNTPNLCRLQKKGIVFPNFYATATKTICSALPLFGSMYNDVKAKQGTAVEHDGFPVPGASLWLKRFGYKSYFLTANGGDNGGWHTFMNMEDTFTPPGSFDVGRDPKQPFWSKGGLDPQRIFASEGYMDKAVFADARRALHDAKGYKFYMMIWNYETHYPYYPGPGPDFDRSRFPESLARLPDRQQDFHDHLRAIWRLDKLIGELYQELENLGLADDTLVVITGDHGEAWGQHGTWIHGDSVYQEEIHVPLILLCPKLAKLPRRLDVIGDHVDVWPTIMDICGLPTDPRWQGRSLLSGGEGRRAYFNNHLSTMLGVREGKYKFILDLEHQSEMLFDLATDPEERHNLAGQHPALCERLRLRLQVWVQYQSRLTRQRIEEARK